MPSPKKILGSEAYSNYRNVRAVSIFFVVLGSIFVLGGLGILLGQDANARDRIHPLIGVGIALVGLAGAIGGIAALNGSRQVSMLVYVMAGIYVFAFPLGTILSFVMFIGLSRYLDSVERLRRQRMRRDDERKTTGHAAAAARETMKKKMMKSISPAPVAESMMKTTKSMPDRVGVAAMKMRTTVRSELGDESELLKYFLPGPSPFAKIA